MNASHRAVREAADTSRARSRAPFAVPTGAALALVLQACGASPPPPASAPAPPAAAPASAGEEAPAASGPAPAAAMAPPAAAPVAPAAPQGASSSMTADVGLELKRAEHDVANGDCPTACRALGSMEHATSFLCTANQTPDDTDRCENARRKVKTARRRVRATCGGCPGGPSVEQDAPIPSTR